MKHPPTAPGVTRYISLRSTALPFTEPLTKPRRERKSDAVELARLRAAACEVDGSTAVER